MHRNNIVWVMLSIALLGIFLLIAIGTVITTLMKVSKMSRTMSSPVEEISDSKSCENEVNSQRSCFNSVKGFRKPEFLPQKQINSQSKIAILIIITSKNETNIVRLIQNTLKLAHGSGIPVKAAVLSQTQAINAILEDFPFIEVLNKPKAFASQKSGLILKNFRLAIDNLIPGAAKRGSCPKEKQKISFNLMNRDWNKSKDFTFEADATLTNQTFVPFGNSKFNPLVLDRTKHHRNTGQKIKSALKCKIAEFIRSSFEHLLEARPHFDNLIMLGENKEFSHDLLSFFNKTCPLFDHDPTVYCISAHNPFLSSEGGSADPQDLMRTDAFVFGGATMVQRSLVEEVAKNYQVEAESGPDGSLKSLVDPLSDLIEWLSWVKNRKLRGCVVPVNARVCSFEAKSSCYQGETIEEFPLKSLVRHTYERRLIHHLQNEAEPLTYAHFPCEGGEMPNITKKYFTIYAKMDSPDDDITIVDIMKCFGVDIEILTGGLEGAYFLSWKGTGVFILGLPFSRYSATIIKGSQLLMKETKDQDAFQEITRYSEHKDALFSMSSVPYLTEE